jgi:hypothetical protein
MKKDITQWLIDWLIDWFVSEWMNELWVGEWVSEWVSEWVWVCVCEEVSKSDETARRHLEYGYQPFYLQRNLIYSHPNRKLILYGYHHGHWYKLLF